MESIKQCDQQKRIAHLLRKMGKHGSAARVQTDCLKLMDLPVDILKLIISEINHTNDLTSLARTNSAIHALVVPQMYARFDIVWPDTAASDDRGGIDALSHGLSTLVLSEETFQQTSAATKRGGKSTERESRNGRRKRRRGNNYAQHTRKFSLGNGPANMISDYLIHKEGGRMLGTLAAMSIARMINLETFIWDMPTGVVQDVWEALASLGDRRDGEPHRLQSVWVRFHDALYAKRGTSARTQRPSMPSAAQPTTFSSWSGPQALATAGVLSSLSNLSMSATDAPRSSKESYSASPKVLRQSYKLTEHPNFSIMPPLKRIAALELDQISYAEELSHLIKNSIHCLEELRIGMAMSQNDYSRGNSGGLESPQLVGESGLTHAGAGGILGMIMSKIYDCRRRQVHEKPNGPQSGDQRGVSESTKTTSAEMKSSGSSTKFKEPKSLRHRPKSESITVSSIDQFHDVLAQTGQSSSLDKAGVFEGHVSATIQEPPQQTTIPQDAPETAAAAAAAAAAVTPLSSTKKQPNKVSNKRKKLHLSVLELERLNLNSRILCKTIDMKHLTSLTLLYCNGDDDFWRVMSKTFPAQSSISLPGSSRHTRPREYPLQLKKLHTNSVTPALIAFLKDNLAPDSLECLFLQDRGLYTPSAGIDVKAIYRGPLRRHRNSLRKLTIDSEDKLSHRTSSWKRWVVDGDALNFIMSGKLSNLRELSISLDHHDWHPFLQSLPNLNNLRSLYIPNFKNSTTNIRLPVARSREYALQVLDVVALRPEIELCYIAFMDKCFEVMETSARDKEAGMMSANQWLVQGMEDSDTEEDEDEDDSADQDDDEDDHDDDDEDEDDDDDDNDEMNNFMNGMTMAGNNVFIADDSSENGAGHVGSGAGESWALANNIDLLSDGSVSDDGVPQKSRLKLREILFYSEMVEIFKIRQAKL
jgi:hypothetical protein